MADNLQLAPATAKQEGLTERVIFQQGTIEALPFDDAAFDLVWCRDVLAHVPDVKQSMLEFARWVEESDRFELAAPAPLNLVCFRHQGGDEINQKLMDQLNQSGELYLTHTRLGDKLTLRLSVRSNPYRTPSRSEGLAANPGGSRTATEGLNGP